MCCVDRLKLQSFPDVEYSSGRVAGLGCIPVTHQRDYGKFGFERLLSPKAVTHRALGDRLLTATSGLSGSDETFSPMVGIKVALFDIKAIRIIIRFWIHNTRMLAKSG